MSTDVPIDNSHPSQGASSLGGSALLSDPVPGQRLLVVKFGAIGDVIMAIPAVTALHEAGWSIDWVASKAVAPVLRLYPWIHVVAVDEPRLLRGSLGARVQESRTLLRELRSRTRERGRYNLVATLYYDFRYGALTALVPAERRIRLSRTDRRFALLPGRHHTDEYARILSGRPDGEVPCQLAPVPPPELPASPRPVSANRPRVLLVPAGARNVLRDDALRRWPIANYVSVAKLLLQRGCEVLLVGGPEDRWAAAHFAEVAGAAAPDAFADLIGTTSLHETLALMNSAVVTVTHDTGPLHLAGLTASGIVSLFGPTDPHGRLPRRNNSVAFWGGEGFACRPCYDGREYAPCAENGCMAQVTPEMAANASMELISARSEGRVLLPRIVLPSPAPFVQISGAI